MDNIDSMESHPDLFWWLDVHKTSSTQAVQKTAGLLLDLMDEAGVKGMPGPGKYRRKLEHDAHVVLCNLIHAYCVDPDIRIGYSREGKWYKEKSVSYNNVVTKTTDFLHDHGYIGTTTGNPAYGEREAQISTMQATDKLIDLLECDPHSVVIYREVPDSELVRVKGKKVKKLKRDRDGKPLLDGYGRKQYEEDRKDVKTPETRQARQITEEIRTINRVNSGARIELNFDQHKLDWINHRLGKPIDFTRTQMYRVFHDRRLDRHGRWYGAWWERIHEDFRHRIVIDGEPVSELDYSFLHPAMLYSMEGIPIPPADDLYLLPETDPDNKPWRKLLKSLTLNMINASTAEDAVGATIGKWGEKTASDIKWEREPTEPPVRLEYPNLMPLVDPIMERHVPIQHHFLTGIGKQLMYEDSRIATRVLMHFAEQDIPCLPVHDSFIVPLVKAQECWDVMQNAFTDRFGQSIPIDYQSVVDVYTLYREDPSVLPMSHEWQQMQEEIHKALGDDEAVKDRWLR